jgi:hypothetical protein
MTVVAHGHQPTSNDVCLECAQAEQAAGAEATQGGGEGSGGRPAAVIGQLPASSKRRCEARVSCSMCNVCMDGGKYGLLKRGNLRQLALCVFNQ